MMNELTSHTVSSLQSVHGILFVSLTSGLDEAGLHETAHQILEHLQREKYRAVFLDVSAIALIGCQGFAMLQNLRRMIKMMGSLVIFIGFQAGVAASVVEFDVDFAKFHTVVTVDDAFVMLEKLQVSAASSP